MDIFEDLGGCIVFAAIALILLILVVGVAAVLIGVALPNLTG